MTLKVIFLVVYGATMVFTQSQFQSNLQLEYTEMIRKEDSQLVREFHAGLNPLLVKRAWDILFAKRVAGIEKARLRVLEALRKSGQPFNFLKVKEDWDKLRDEGIYTIIGHKRILDGIRTEAVLKAPQEWNYFVRISIQNKESFERVVATGNTEDIRKIMYHNLEYLRECSQIMRKIIDSKQ